MSKVQSGLRTAFRQPAFLLVTSILLIGAVGLNGATHFMKLHFRKLPIDLRRPLVEFPEKIGPWVQGSIDEPLDPDMEHTLGTGNYIFRDYIDTRLVASSVIDGLKDKSAGERGQILRQIQTRNPSAVVNMALTYYTGLVDTVAHVPDRCFVADGYEPTHYTIEPWEALKNTDGDHAVRYIVFEDQSSTSRRLVPRNVAYFFSCDGRFMNDPIDVRRELADLRQRYGYYLKVEVHTQDIPQDKAAAVMNDLLTFAVPEVQKSLPDWDRLTAGK